MRAAKVPTLGDKTLVILQAGNVNSGAFDPLDEICERASFRILNDVVFNQVLVACNTPEQTTITINNLQQSGGCWCGEANWHNTPVIRVSVCSWATTTEDN